MSVRIECPECFAAYTVKDEFRGRKIRCKTCSAVIEVPDEDAAPSGRRSNVFDDDLEETLERSAPAARRRSSGGRAADGGYDYAKSRVMAPAIIQLTLGALWALIITLGTIVNLGQGLPPPPPRVPGEDPAAAQAREVGFKFGQICATIGFPLLAIVIVAGSASMMMLRMRGLAMAASILSVIPCCSSFILLGIPVGIWCLVVLNDPAVSREFT